MLNVFQGACKVAKMASAQAASQLNQTAQPNRPEPDVSEQNLVSFTLHRITSSRPAGIMLLHEILGTLMRSPLISCNDGMSFVLVL